MDIKSVLVPDTIIQKMYIDGRWVESDASEKREIINPANGEVIGIVTEGSAQDAKNAIAVAHRAFYDDGWMNSKARDRADRLLQISNN
ncbi:aldehyde dehydrogenase family protein [Bacillaceae bacterium C204]|uniref:aldehyde dehydrogenase family protein n=1 Tax=Neobacillus sp. 204 TaxID=3383351 RepID=UPI0039797763